MEVHIDDKELEKIYITGKSNKLRLPVSVVEKFFAIIQKIESATNIGDIWADKGLRFEKLHGTVNSFSMRLTGKYRLEMEVIWMDEKFTVGKFYLKTISNHYGD